MKDNKILEVYTKLGLNSSKGNLCTLHTECPNSSYCWQNAQNRIPSHANWTISRPWIGPKYNELGLLAIGINMNNYGDYDAIVELIERTKKELLQGKTKMFREKDGYSGTFLFHRMGSYVTAIAESESLLTPTWRKNFPLHKDIVPALDFISYINHIKCSPRNLKKNDRSEPTEEMWEKCGGFILKQEIELLKPKKILVLGKSQNYTHLNNLVFNNTISMDWDEGIGIGKGLFNNRIIDIIVVPHPTSFGGNKRKIIVDLRNLLHK